MFFLLQELILTVITAEFMEASHVCMLLYTHICTHRHACENTYIRTYMYVIYVTMYAIYKDLSTIDVECNFQIKCECDGVRLSCSTFYLYFFLTFGKYHLDNATSLSVREFFLFHSL